MIIRRPESNTLEKKFTFVDWAEAINYIEILPTDMTVDDILTEVEGGQVFNIVDCFDFQQTKRSAIWFSFNFPIRWKTNRDITLDLYYSLDGYDLSKAVDMNIKLWVINLYQSADESEPTINNTESIYSAIETIGTYQKHTPDPAFIPSENLTTKECIIAGKIERSRYDAYQGTFKLIKIVARQI